MRLINKTKIPNGLIKSIIRFVRPAGIKNFRVLVTNSKYTYAGRGGSNGIKIRVNINAKYPRILKTYQYGQLKGRRYYLASLTECLIYVIAHELMHVRQGQCGALRGRVWGARGRYSEIETESYAIRKLREYRANT